MAALNPQFPNPVRSKTLIHQDHNMQMSIHIFDLIKHKNNSVLFISESFEFLFIFLDFLNMSFSVFPMLQYSNIKILFNENLNIVIAA